MACVCAECGESITKPYKIDGSFYGSTCVKKYIKAGSKKPKAINGNWVSADLISELTPATHLIEFIYKGKIYKTNASSYNKKEGHSIYGALVSKDQLQSMINLDYFL
jgi:hypothetical protein